jgi:hypothetical protein
MAKYSGTYNCGHEGTTQIYGKVKYRQYKADKHFEKLCPDCYKKKKEEERQKKNQEALKKSKEMELPELTGSQKQIKWANTIRLEMHEKAEDEIEYELNRYTVQKENNVEELENNFYESLNYMLKNKTKASWYIDNRDRDIVTLLAEIYQQMPDEEEIIEQEIKEKEKAELKAEATIYPENKKKDIVAEINIKNDKVSVYYPKDDDFYNIVKKELNYKWNDSEWVKTISFRTGSKEDRAAELGNKLLNNGFPIRIYDEEIRQKAINADYKTEHTRWISKMISGKYENWFCVTWDYEEDYYQKARSLPESRYDGDGGVVIKKEYYKQIEEFAELFDFRFSPGAKELIEETKKEDEILQEKSKKVNPADSKEKEEGKNGLEKILESDDVILDDLRDD